MTPDPESARRPLELLSLCDLFSHLNPSNLEPAELAALTSEVRIVRLRRGELLVKQGDPSDCMYTVVRGSLQVLVEGADGERNLVNELHAGETVGEMGLIDGSARMATVVANRDSELVRVSAAGFGRLARSDADSFGKIARSQAERMRSMGQRRYPAAAVRAIAVMGAGQRAGVEGFTVALCTALGKLGTVLHLSRSRFEALYSQNLDSDGAIADWLSELEDDYRFVVFEAESTFSSWTMRCLLQADRILAVGDAAGSPGLSPTERAVIDECRAGRMAPLELLLLHETGGPVFPGVSQWLAGRGAIRHHHVRTSVPGDVSRVAHFLAGRALGLTLGGGGARGFAHIGVLRAFDEAGVSIDMVGGVSMGAIIAALYAMGHKYGELIRLMKREWTGRMTADFALPIVALSTGRRFRRALRTFFGETAIEDLGLGFFCTSCNLSTGEMAIHRAGSLLDAVHASNAVPVVLPPFLSGGQLLIDGGVLNNQPGDVMKRICGGQVAVVNVSPRRDVTVDTSLTEMPSAWRILRSRLNPFEATIGVPGIAVTMMRTMMVASDRKSREVESMSDFYLRPPIERFRVDDFARIEEIAGVGYEYAREEIRVWKENGRFAT